MTLNVDWLTMPSTTDALVHALNRVWTDAHSRERAPIPPAAIRKALEEIEKYQRAMSWIEDQEPQIVAWAKDKFQIS